MAKSFFRVDQQGIRAMFLEPGKPVQSHIREKAFNVQRRARGKIKSRSGDLAKSLTIVQFRNGLAVIAAMPYALFVHEGTRPHLILPKTKKVLAWRDETTGAVVFAARAHHPGTQANPFLRDALREEFRRAA